MQLTASASATCLNSNYGREFFYSGRLLSSLPNACTNSSFSNGTQKYLQQFIFCKLSEVEEQKQAKLNAAK